MSQSDDQIYDGIPASRKASWEQRGIDAIESDLKHNQGMTYVGGPLEAREQAWVWVRKQRRMQQQRTSDAGVLLKTLFRETKGGRTSFHLPSVRVHFDEWGDDRYYEAATALIDDGSIALKEVPPGTGYGNLTVTGRERAEEKMTPKGDTHNTINIGSAHGVNIQQAGAGAVQTQSNTYSVSEIGELRKLLEFLSDNVKSLALDSRIEQDTLAKIETAAQELQKSAPDRKITSEILQSIRKIFESATGGVIAKLVSESSAWNWAMTLLTVGSEPILTIPML